MDRSLDEDLLKLWIFKCKFCTRRLQYPVMEVEGFGNICGNCYGRSVFTNVTANKEVESILLKMYVKCNFADRGCDINEEYRSTCNHENVCYFRDRICPFSFQDECENILIENIIDHIQENHAHNVLHIMDNYVLVSNPLPPNYNDILYLLKSDDKYFLLRIKYNNEEEVFSYTFYDFSSRLEREEVEFLISIQNENIKLESQHVLPTHESNISQFDKSDCLKMKLSILKCVESFEIVKILVNKKGNVEMNKSALEYQCADWFKCSNCDEYSFEGVNFCSTCGAKTCYECYKRNLYCSSCKAAVIKKLDYHNLASMFKFPCTNNDCKESISAVNYKLHKNICSLAQYKCIYIAATKSCPWKGTLARLILHLKEVHADSDKIIGYKTNTVGDYICALIKYKTVFQCDFGFRSNNIFYIKVGGFAPSHINNCYLWTLHIRNKRSQNEFLISNNCTNIDDAVEEEVVNIEKYLEDNMLNYTISIKRKDN